MKYWTFLDYFDESGVNVIQGWLNSLPLAARVEINTRIQYLATMERLANPQYSKMLHGECDGLFELKIKHKNIQYRPLACYGPDVRSITLLIGAIERGGKFEPQSACRTALLRKSKIQEPGRTYEHSFEEP